MMIRISLWMLFVAIVTPGLRGRGDDPPRDDQPLTFKLTVEPRGEPSPALKYQLLPRYEERKPGNAAPFYYRAILLHTQLPREVHETHARNSKSWLEVPLDEMPRDEVRKWLNHYANALEELKTAVAREHCHWDIRLRDLTGLDTIEVRLPEFQESRGLARMLQVKARLEIAEGRFDDAIETLSTGYQLGIDVARPATLINNLIGIAICTVMNEELRELIDQPGAPNCYWALTALPRPMISMRESMQQEMTMALRMFPFLRDAETAQRSPDQWKAVIADAIRKLVSVSETEVSLGGEPALTQAQLNAAELVRKFYPLAKRELIAGGWNKEAVEAMPAEQVVAIQTARAYHHIYQELYKWTLVPHPEAHQRLSDGYKRLRSKGYLGEAGGDEIEPGAKEVLPVATLLLPALEAARYAEIRLERQFAGLRTIEAIRMYADAHKGRLPAALGAIEKVPAPLDPFTGKPFLYRVQNDTAIVEMNAPPGQPARFFARRWEIRLDVK